MSTCLVVLVPVSTLTVSVVVTTSVGVYVGAPGGMFDRSSCTFSLVASVPYGGYPFNRLDKLDVST